MFTAAGFAKALAYWKLFLQGVVCTVCLSFLTVLFGFLLAFSSRVCGCPTSGRSGRWP